MATRCFNVSCQFPNFTQPFILQRAKSVEASKFPNEFRPRPRMMSEGDGDAAPSDDSITKSKKARSQSVTSNAASEMRTPTLEGDAAAENEAEPLVNGGLSAPSLVRSFASSSSSPSEQQNKVWNV